MEAIVESVRVVSHLIDKIASASLKQSTGIEQVKAAMTQMDQAVQQNAALVERAAAASASIQDQARALLDAVGRFDFGPDTAVQSPDVAPAPLPVPRKGWREF
jgi:methyl-accepting chemotaxis protein